MNAIRTYNVEAGLPTLDEARRRAIAENSFSVRLFSSGF